MDEPEGRSRSEPEWAQFVLAAGVSPRYTNQKGLEPRSGDGELNPQWSRFLT